MTTATAPASLFTLPGTDPVRSPGPPSPADKPREAPVTRLSHGRVTLDELVSGAWAAVASGAPAACPVCDGTLTRAPSGAAANCSRCGSELA